jgi:hypothetical protein
MSVGDKGALYINLKQESIRLGNILGFPELNDDYI